MYIEEGEIIGYRYEVYFDHCCLHEDDEVYDTEDDAENAARDWCREQIEDWKLDGGYNGETVDDFHIMIRDVIGEDNEDDEE